jgi:A/G-specific adenine glycosylase
LRAIESKLMLEELDGVGGKAPETFSTRLLAWHAHHGRHDLPWQQERTLYRVWVSEIMLQQTQVATVVDYFQRFISRFPDIQSLAAANEDDVLHLWSGLGYYARARNLLKAARLIASEHGGQFPTSLHSIEALPGIGRSTAGAILAQALDERHPILDGNVKRVLARWAGIEGYSGIAAVSDQLWSLADQLTPDTRACDYTQAIMDLGATCCRLRHPDCNRCPITTDCVARISGRIKDFPTPKPKASRPVRRAYWLILLDEAGDAVLLKRRPSEGLWGGLYGFIDCDNASNIADEHARRRPLAQAELQSLPIVRHAFTHFELLIHPFVGRGQRIVEAGDETWYNLGQPPSLGIAAPVALLLEILRSGESEARNGMTGSG